MGARSEYAPVPFRVQTDVITLEAYDPTPSEPVYLPPPMQPQPDNNTGTISALGATPSPPAVPVSPQPAADTVKQPSSGAVESAFAGSTGTGLMVGAAAVVALIALIFLLYKAWLLFTSRRTSTSNKDSVLSLPEAVPVSPSDPACATGEPQPQGRSVVEMTSKPTPQVISVLRERDDHAGPLALAAAFAAAEAAGGAGPGCAGPLPPCHDDEGWQGPELA